jgi:chromosome segregation protein
VLVILLQLHKLEAYGFKSFAEKTVLELGAGVTAIVGPNGSGKSNVADAIRWALGEQSMKSLRGAKSEDIIFSGSSARRALGLAEVSLYFDNSDGLLPLDFAEVVITRRIFRSGDSEFFINKSPCRLKDIHELFADTGVGRDSMMVIGQNKIDEILNAKPEERRLIFEEAAGITKYKQRKRDSVRKIEETDSNMTRLEDIISEIEGQLGPLKDSAIKTKKYNELHDEWLVCQVSQLLQRLTKAEQILVGANSDYHQFAEQEVLFSSKLAVADTERDKRTSELAKADEACRNVSVQLKQIEGELTKQEATVGILDERQSQNRRELERLVTDRTSLIDRTAENRDKSKRSCEEYEIKLKDQRSLQDKLVLLDEQQKNAADAQAQLTKQIETGKEQIFDCMQELISQRNRCRELEKELNSLGGQKESQSAEVAKEQQQLEKLETFYQEKTAELAQLKAQQLADKEHHGLLLTRKKELEQELGRLKQQETQLQLRLNDRLTRKHLLVHMQQDYDGFGKGIKSILKSDASWRSQVFGAVAELIQVPPHLVTAIEIALGGAAQHLITDHAQTAQAAIHYLKKNHLGRVTFLPLNTVQSYSRRDAERSAAQEQGVLGFASDLVTYDKVYALAMAHVLGRTLIVDTLDHALVIAKKYRYSLRMVTLEGELVSPGGSLTGGSSQRRENSFIGRQSEINRLDSEIESQRQIVCDQQQQSQAVCDQLKQLDGELIFCQKSLQENEVSQAQRQVQNQQILQDMQRIRQSVKNLMTEKQLREEQVKLLGAELVLVQQRVNRLEQEDDERKQTVTGWQEKNKIQQVSLAFITEQVTGLKITLSALTQQLQAVEQNRTLYEANLRETENQLDLLMKQQDKAQVCLDETAAELLRISELKKRLAVEKQEQELKLRQFEQQKLVALSAVAACDKDAKAIHKQLQEVQGRIHERELLITKYDAEVAACNTQLESQFQLTRETAQPYYQEERPIDELIAAGRRLERQIAELGPINAGAIDEFTRLKERYDFLQQQVNDLIEAKKYLVSIVQEMDQTMSKQFKQAFDKINDYFHEIFTKLFGGGQAKLVLVSPHELLNTGIDIIVQPPGKKQQYLSLFSGGERSLTVIALLFSFLSYRPAPFCMVDEIDAALDEANVTRFSEFLKEYAANTQFIVVTHRKGTMEIADVLHGITMEESGVSKLLSVKFAEQAG